MKAEYRERAFLNFWQMTGNENQKSGDYARAPHAFRLRHADFPRRILGIAACPKCNRE